MLIFAKRLSADQRGFTLIEALVAISMGVIVTGALFTILEISTRQTARLTERAQTTQLARATLTHIVDELRSSCFWKQTTPVQEKSTERTLVFRNAFGETNAVIPYTAAAERTIEYEAAKHRLVEFVKPASGGSYPTFEYNGTVTKRVIGEHIYQAAPKGTAIPFFSYSEYNTSSTSSSESAVNTLTPQALTTESTELKTASLDTAAVTVAFAVAPASGVSSTNRNSEVSSQVTFAFSVPNAETPIKAGPCE